MTHIENLGSVKPPLNDNKVVVKKVIPVLTWDTLTYAKRLNMAKFILLKMTGNTDFPSPWPVNVVLLHYLEIDIQAFDDALVESKTRAKGTAETLEKTCHKVYKDLRTIQSMLQLMLDLDPEDAERMCADAGFDRKSMATRAKRKREVQKGNESGSLIITDEGPGMRQWQMSADGGVTSSDLPPTTGGITSVSGLAPDKDYVFRCRLVNTKNRYGDWTSWFGEKKP
jgi:hypothetical protein